MIGASKEDSHHKQVGEFKTHPVLQTQLTNWGISFFIWFMSQILKLKLSKYDIIIGNNMTNIIQTCSSRIKLIILR